MTRIAVGSGKSYKIEATVSACKLVFGSIPFSVQGIAVESGVSSQPMSHEESISGARNRAISALEHGPESCDVGIGIENGLVQILDQWFATTWIVALNASGSEGVASTLHRPVPPALIDLVQQGQELSFAIREFYGNVTDRGHDGLIGLITQGALNRHDVLRDGIVVAFSPIVNRRLFDT